MSSIYAPQTASTTLSSAVLDRVSNGGLHLDDGQQALVEEVCAWLAPALEGAGGTPSGTSAPSAPETPVGVFVHGSAGRGKTWLLGQIFASADLPDSAKRRIHFHEFFLALQKRLGARVSAKDAIEATVEDLLDGTRLFFFDELHVQDPGAAALLNKLLAEIAQRRVPTLITSNYAPESLLPHPVYHHVVQPGIDTLRASFTVRELAGDTDYRRQGDSSARFASGEWVVVPDDVAGVGAAGHAGGPTSSGLTVSVPGQADLEPAEATTVLKDHHSLAALAVRDRCVIFDARVLLESPVTSKDVLDLVASYDEWILLGLPPLSELSRPARQRLVTVVDILVDADAALTVTSTVAREDLNDVADPPADMFRALSRLQLLGSAAA